MSKERHSVLPAAAVGHRSTALETRHQRISAKYFTPSDEAFELPLLAPTVVLPNNIGHKKHGSGIWKPSGYATASSQASRLATKQLPAPESLPPLASITPRTNVIEMTTASGNKIKAPSSTTISLLKIQELQKALGTLQSGFTFPEHLDFLDEQLVSDNSPLGYLDFTKNNRPVRDHKEVLIRLQTDINSIQSYDNEFVRMSRRDVVDKTGQALHDLEEKVQRHLDYWRENRLEEPRIEKQEPPLENPKPPASQPSRTFLRPQIPTDHISTTFNTTVESPHRADGQSISLTLTPDVCRLVGNDSRFHKVYMEMSSEIAKVQMKRIDALSKGHPIDELDEALMTINRDWETFVHSLVVVKRSEEKSEHAMLEWNNDSVVDSDYDTHYLSLVLDPNDNEQSS